MQCMLLTRVGPAEHRLLEYRERESSQPGPGQVLIRVEACGVCRTDLHLVEGEVAAPLPRVPGHQAVGRIVQLGEGVTCVGRGERVGVGWLHSTCGECVFCTTGRENLCIAAQFTGRDVDGGFAPFLVADEKYVYPLPDTLSSVEAAPLLCAGIIGYRALKLSGICSGGRLGLIGFGASAHLALQVALHWGCEVYAFDRTVEHQRFALERGAHWAGGIGDNPPRLVEAVVTFAPAGEVVPRALDLLVRGGTVAINAIHMSPIPQFSYDSLYWEKTVRSVANFTREDALEFLALAGTIPIRANYEKFSLHEAPEALLRIKQGRVRGAAVLEMD